MSPCSSARSLRYRIDEECLESARRAVTVARRAADERDVAWTIFCSGFLLLWYGDLTTAEEQLREALTLADRIGDVLLRSRCLCYLNFTAVRRHDVEYVRLFSSDALAAAEAAHYDEYVAAAKAAMSWLAWQDGRFDDITALAEDALATWDATLVRYSWCWLCLWPLIAVGPTFGGSKARHRFQPSTCWQPLSSAYPTICTPSSMTPGSLSSEATSLRRDKSWLTRLGSPPASAMLDVRRLDHPRRDEAGVTIVLGVIWRADDSRVFVIVIMVLHLVAGTGASHGVIVTGGEFEGITCPTGTAAWRWGTIPSTTWCLPWWTPPVMSAPSQRPQRPGTTETSSPVPRRRRATRRDEHG